MGNKEKENQQDKVISSKEQKRLGFLEYLQKAQKEIKKRKKEDKNMIGLGGTPVRPTVRRNSIIEGDNINPSIDAVEYARVFKKAVEEKNKKQEQKDESEERE